jgi:hypothetical protein
MCRNIHNTNVSYTGTKTNDSNVDKETGNDKQDKDISLSDLQDKDIESKEAPTIDEVTIKPSKKSITKSKKELITRDSISRANKDNKSDIKSPISITEKKSPNKARINPNQFADQDYNEEFMKEGEYLLLHYLNTAPKVWLLLLKIPEFDADDNNDTDNIDNDMIKCAPLSTILADKIAELRLEEEFTSINQLNKLGIDYDNTLSNLILLNINNDTLLQYQRYYQHDLDVSRQNQQRKVFHQVN